MVTEESAKKAVKTIVQGMPVDAVYPRLLTPVLSFRTGGLGCNAHPAFPAPSFIYEGDLLPTTRTFRAARTRSHASLPTSSRTSEARSETITTNVHVVQSWGRNSIHR